MKDIQQLLGKKIRDLRTRRGMTQQQLGEKADLNYKYVGAIERGEKNPTLLNLVKLGGALDVQLHVLFVFDNVVDDPPLVRSKIEGFLEKASEKDLRTIYRIIEVVLNKL
jgi:transcriptional regulator with XRE-family HTH domain